MSEINVLAARIHEISTSKGFTPPSLENLPEKLMLSVSELVEALEEHRNHKPLVYWKCATCGTERSMRPTRDSAHWLPLERGFMAWLRRALGVSIGQPVVCPGKLSDDGLSAPLGYVDWKPEGILIEIGDSIIRNLHMMHSLIEQHDAYRPGSESDMMSIRDILDNKVDYNEGRSAMHGGRAY